METRNHSPSSRVSIGSYIMPILLIVIFLLTLIDRYRGWSILLIGLGGPWLFSYIWILALSRGLQIKRERICTWAQVGDQLTERFQLINASRFPAFWIEVKGQTNMPDYWANQVRSVKPNGTAGWQIRGRCTRRGIYTLGPTTLETSDPFGFFKLSISDPTTAALLVMPPVVTLPRIEVSPGGHLGEGVPQANAPERTVSAASVRAYQPGDSYRGIHWPTSARRNELFVRIFEGSPTGDWWIILDLHQDVQIGEGQDSTQEHAIILAASLTSAGLTAGYSVGLITHGDHLVWHRPQKGDDHKWSILHDLAVVDTGAVSLAEILSAAHPGIPAGSSLIVITPSHSQEWLPPLLSLRRTGRIPTVFHFDPESFGADQAELELNEQLAALEVSSRIIPRTMLEHTSVQSLLPPANNPHQQPYSPYAGI